MSLKVLFLGEIVGRAGLTAVKKFLPSFRQEEKIDLVVANAEGTTNGFGLGKAHAMQLTHLGINLLTGGEKIFYKVEMVEFFPKCSFVLRPMNYPQKTPGKGYRIVEIAGKRVAIINMLGQSGFSRVCVMNPLNAADMILTSPLWKDADYQPILPECINNYKNRKLQ